MIPEVYDENDHNSFDKWYDYYYAWGNENDVKSAIWSIYGKKMDELAFEGKYLVKYQGEFLKVENPTWGDLYKAGDKLIRLSGDYHHIFIEDFEIIEDEVLEMGTGS